VCHRHEGIQFLVRLHSSAYQALRSKQKQKVVNQSGLSHFRTNQNAAKNVKHANCSEQPTSKVHHQNASSLQAKLQLRLGAFCGKRHLNRARVLSLVTPQVLRRNGHSVASPTHKASQIISG
jgi:hypothetical protein